MYFSILSGMKAIFLDRDGTLNNDTGYLSKFDEFNILPGTLEALAVFQTLGYKLFIVTNQSGVARGFFGEDEVKKLNRQIQEYFASHHIIIEETRYCPHHPDGTVPEFTKPCNCRKPGTGMIKNILEKHPVSLKDSYIVGDKLSDTSAGEPLGIKGVLVQTGHPLPAKIPENVSVFDDLLGFAKSLE